MTQIDAFQDLTTAFGNTMFIFAGLAGALAFGGLLVLVAYVTIRLGEWLKEPATKLASLVRGKIRTITNFTKAWLATNVSKLLLLVMKETWQILRVWPWKTTFACLGFLFSPFLFLWLASVNIPWAGIGGILAAGALLGVVPAIIIGWLCRKEGLPIAIGASLLTEGVSAWGSFAFVASLIELARNG